MNTNNTATVANNEKALQNQLAAANERINVLERERKSREMSGVYVDLLKDLLNFEIKCQKAIQKQYRCEDMDELVMALYEKKFKAGAEKIREQLNDDLCEILHNELLDEIVEE